MSDPSNAGFTKLRIDLEEVIRLTKGLVRHHHHQAGDHRRSVLYLPAALLLLLCSSKQQQPLLCRPWRVLAD